MSCDLPRIILNCSEMFIQMQSEFLKRQFKDFGFTVHHPICQNFFFFFLTWTRENLVIRLDMQSEVNQNTHPSESLKIFLMKQSFFKLLPEQHENKRYYLFTAPLALKNLGVEFLFLDAASKGYYKSRITIHLYSQCP